MKIGALLLRLALAVGATGLTLVGAELLARWLAPQWAPQSADRLFWCHDPLLGWANVANVSGRFRHPNFTVRVDHNELGLRDASYPLVRTAGKQRLLVVGDSFAWGYGVERNERFSELIEARQPGWEIINAGVSGYGTDQQYLYLLHQGLKFSPDIVLVLLHDNDFENNLHTVEYWHAKPRFRLRDGELTLENSPVPKPTARQRVGRWILARTYLYAQLYRGTRRFWQPRSPQAQASRQPPTSIGDQQPATGQTGQPAPAGGDITLALLEAMARLARNQQARLVVVGVQTGEVNSRFLASRLATLGIPFLSLDATFHNPQRAYTFPNDIHWNAAGHQLAAIAIEAFLQELEILPATRPAAK